MAINVYLIRTKLQALIVKELVSSNFRSNKSVFVFIFQSSKSEDNSNVYQIYNDLKRESWFSLDLVMGESFVGAVVKLFLLNLLAFFTRGKVLLAGIDGYPFAVASRLTPLTSVETFDDGSANILSWSKYYSELPLERGSIRRLILRSVFPKGCAYYLRSRSNRHYTIFPDHENILNREKVVPLNWDWRQLLCQCDLKIIGKDVSCVALGTPVDDHSESSEIKNKALGVLRHCDLYIMHPREREWFEDHKAVKLISPAESVLIELSKHKSLTVYHFNSTVAFSLSGHKGIKFIDLKGCGYA